jgi:hypothetical protein
MSYTIYYRGFIYDMGKYGLVIRCGHHRKFIFCKSYRKSSKNLIFDCCGDNSLKNYEETYFMDSKVKNIFDFFFI